MISNECVQYITKASHLLIYIFTTYFIFQQCKNILNLRYHTDVSKCNFSLKGQHERLFEGFFKQGMSCIHLVEKYIRCVFFSFFPVFCFENKRWVLWKFYFHCVFGLFTSVFVKWCSLQDKNCKNKARFQITRQKWLRIVKCVGVWDTLFARINSRSKAALYFLFYKSQFIKLQWTIPLWFGFLYTFF